MSAVSGPPDTPSAADSVQRPRKNDRPGRGKQYYGRTAKRGALWSMMRQGGNELVTIPSSVIMARLLSPHEFGIAAASAFFIGLASRLTQFGFSAALVRVKDLRREHATSVLVVNLAMGIATYIALFTSAPYIGSFFHSAEAGRLLPIAALSFLIGPFGTVPGALIQRRMQFRYTTIVDWTDTLVGTCISLVLAFSGYSYWSLAWGNLGGLAVRVVLQMGLAEWWPTLRCSRAALRDLLSYGFGLQAKRLLEYASSNLDNLAVGRVLGVTSLGLYDKAFTTMNRLVTRLTFGQAPFRIFSIIHEDRERFRRAYARLVVSITMIGFPVLTACIVVARPLFAVIYGPKWQASVLPFQLLCAGGMAKLLSAYASQANEAAGNIWRQAQRQAVGTVLVVVGAALGSTVAGVAGAAFGVLVAILVLTVMMQDLVRQATGLTWRGLLDPQIPALTCSGVLVVVLVAAAAALRVWIPAPRPWELLLVQASAGALWYIAFIAVSPFPLVRLLIAETIEDTVPARWLPAFGWIRRPLLAAANASVTAKGEVA